MLLSIEDLHNVILNESYLLGDRPELMVASEKVLHAQEHLHLATAVKLRDLLLGGTAQTAKQLAQADAHETLAAYIKSLRSIALQWRDPSPAQDGTDSAKVKDIPQAAGETA